MASVLPPKQIAHARAQLLPRLRAAGPKGLSRSELNYYFGRPSSFDPILRELMEAGIVREEDVPTRYTPAITARVYFFTGGEP